MGSKAVSSGNDGQYRMIVEDRYKHMALARRGIRYVFPLYFLIGAAKLAWLVLPYAAGPQFVNPFYVASFSTVYLGGLLAWLIAGFGGRSERFFAVMLFNLLTVGGVGFHIATRFKYHITPPEQRTADDPEVGAMALIKLLPQLRASSASVLQAMQLAEVAVDAGFIVIGGALAIIMHQYITEKKAVRKEDGGTKKTR